MSINRSAAGITSSDAQHIVYDQSITGGAIGNATAAQQAAGLDSPNVQAAIDDIWSKALVQPGQVITTLSGTNPAVAPSPLTSQTTKLTVTGTPTANGNITVIGINIAVLTSDTQNTVATKIQTALSALPYISSATVASNVVTYTYNDTGAHPVDNKVQNGITMSTQTTTLGNTPGYLGYGSWELLGSETKYTRTFYSWLRVA